MDEDYLTLKRASARRPSGDWNGDDFDVLAERGRRALRVHLGGDVSHGVAALAVAVERALS